MRLTSVQNNEIIHYDSDDMPILIQMGNYDRNLIVKNKFRSFLFCPKNYKKSDGQKTLEIFSGNDKVIFKKMNVDKLIIRTVKMKKTIGFDSDIVPILIEMNHEERKGFKDSNKKAFVFMPSGSTKSDGEKFLAYIGEQEKRTFNTINRDM